MKIIETPQYGPMFRFTDANVYWALYVLSDGKRMGRKRLSEEIGVGEGSMRRILETLRQWEMITIKQTGITITRSGLGFLSEIPIRVVDLDLRDEILGSHSQAVIVSALSKLKRPSSGSVGSYFISFSAVRLLNCVLSRSRWRAMQKGETAAPILKYFS